MWNSMRRMQAQFRVTDLERQMNAARDQAQKLKSQRSDAQQRQSEAQSRLTQIRNQQDQIKQQRTSLIKEKHSRQIQEKDLKQQHEETLERKAKIQSKLSSLSQKLMELRGKIDSFPFQIMRIQLLLATPAPHPQYQLDGLYCMNNIYMCKNHPPRQVIANQDEIYRYERTIAQAHADKARLEGERNQAESQYREMYAEYNRTKEEATAAQKEVEQLESRKKEEQEAIKQVEEALSKCDNDEQDLQNEEVQSQNQLYSSESEAPRLINEITSADQRATFLQQQLQNALQELNFINNQAPEPVAIQSYNPSTADLEAFARQELAQGRASQTSVPSTPAAYTLEELERIAREEIERDKAAARATLDAINRGKKQVLQWGRDVVTTAGDIWPHAGAGAATKAIMNDAQRVAGMHPENEHDGDFFIDNGNQRRLAGQPSNQRGGPGQ